MTEIEFESGSKITSNPEHNGLKGFSTRYKKEAEEIVGMCGNVFLKDNTPEEVRQLVMKIAIKIDQIISDECSDCEYMIQAEDRPTEPIYDPNDLD